MAWCNQFKFSHSCFPLCLLQECSYCKTITILRLLYMLCQFFYCISGHFPVPRKKDAVSASPSSFTASIYCIELEVLIVLIAVFHIVIIVVILIVVLVVIVLTVIVLAAVCAVAELVVILIVVLVVIVFCHLRYLLKFCFFIKQLFCCLMITGIVFLMSQKICKNFLGL